MSTEIWTEKYRPRRVNDVVGNREAKEKFLSWLKVWLAGKVPSKKAALLYGPPGCGKTTLVHAAAEEYNLEVIEMNASDVRTANALSRVIKTSIKERSLFGYKGKIVLLDEVDGINLREDIGALRAIESIISETIVPVVLTANNPWDPKLRSLRDKCLLIEFRPIPSYLELRVLRKICEREGIRASDDVLRAIIKRNKGDLRACINDLQAIAQGKKIITLEDLRLLGERSHQLSMFDIVRQVFLAKKCSEAKAVTLNPSFDYQMFMQYIHENLPYQYSMPEALAEAYDALSKADVIMGRIKKTQNWGLLPYALELMTAGVAIIKHKPRFRFVRYSFPEKLRILSKSKEYREKLDIVLEAIKKKCHLSKSKANIEILPYIMVIYEVNKEEGKKLLKWLGVSEKTFKEILDKRT
ncbi:MAG: replication factor C large subunit [Thermoprotei archaeon]|nr:MAG: replication factor C large subunit [Thermoprotei archaeon]HDI75106.1 replication factor C large subunit [Thermoprotei archaeon]